MAIEDLGTIKFKIQAKPDACLTLPSNGGSGTVMSHTGYSTNYSTPFETAVLYTRIYSELSASNITPNGVTNGNLIMAMVPVGAEVPSWFETQTTQFTIDYERASDVSGNTERGREGAATRGGELRQNLQSFSVVRRVGGVQKRDYTKTIEGRSISLTEAHIQSLFDKGKAQIFENYKKASEVNLDDPLIDFNSTKDMWISSISGSVQYFESEEVEVEAFIFYDTATGETLVNPSVASLNERAGEDAEDLAAALAQQEKELAILQKAMADVQLGVKVVYKPIVAPKVYTDLKTEAYRRHFLDWFSAFQTEMLKLTQVELIKPATYEANLAAWLALPENAGKTAADYAAHIASTTSQADPGSSAWSSIWNTIKSGVGGAWDTITQWGPTDIVGAYAGYKGVQVASDAVKSINPYVTMGLLAGLAFLILR